MDKIRNTCRKSWIKVISSWGRAAMEEDNLENSLTEMDWLLQLNGFSNGEADDQESQEVQHGAVDFSLVRSSETSCPPVLNYRSKPPFSYTHLITEAISSTRHKRMSLSEIYQWIRENYPYYRTAAPGWKVCEHLFMKICFVFFFSVRY